MGNCDVVVIFNNGLCSFLFEGKEYNDNIDLIQKSLKKWDEWDTERQFSTGYPDQLPQYKIISIQIFEL